MSTATSTFDDALEAYFETAQDVSNTYHDKNYSNVPRDTFELQRLKRYARIVRGGSVHSFVDATNGDILKPAGWSKPAKHARGNIYTADHGRSAIGPYGPNYLR